MKLLIQHLRFPLPVSSYCAADHPRGESVTIRMPANDPKSIGIVPGMEGDLELDDGTRHRVRIGKRWHQVQQGAELRIEVVTVAAAPT